MAFIILVRRIEDVVQAIRDCDFGVIPNRRSIFTELNTPTRIFEYFSCGKPVIAPRVPGIRDYFADGQTRSSLNSATKCRGSRPPATSKFAYGHPQEVEAIILRGQQIYLEHRWSEERLRLVEHVSQILNGHAYPFKG